MKMDIRFYKSIISDLEEYFSFSSRFFISVDRPLIFLCGGADKKNSARYIFLDYLKKHHRKLDITIAEDFFQLENSSEDLLSVENKLAEYADCIVLFVESPGSVAELGAFANHDELVKKLLVINEKQHVLATSFINEGCINRVRAKSEYKNVLSCDMKSPLYIAEKIVQEIESNKRKKRRVFSFVPEELNLKNQLYLLISLLTLVSPIDEKDLIKIVEAVKFFPKKQEAKRMLNVITTLGLVHNSKEGYLYPEKYYLDPFLQHHRIGEMKKIRAKILQYYRKNDMARIEWLNSYVKNEG